MERRAYISPDQRFRYWLSRSWQERDEPTKYVCWIGLNPSTADGTQDDPTIRRLIEFTKSWGLNGFVIVNLFALRSPKPSALLRSPDPVGPENDSWILEYALGAALLVACWGTKGGYRGRDTEVLQLLHTVGPVSCLGRNGGGSPRHPLYLPGSTRLEVL